MQTKIKNVIYIIENKIKSKTGIRVSSGKNYTSMFFD